MAEYHAEALAYASSGNWDKAHRLIQVFEDPIACQIHGYLHRIEGDESNAGYWYHRAGMVIPDNSLHDETERLRRIV